MTPADKDRIRNFLTDIVAMRAHMKGTTIYQEALTPEAKHMEKSEKRKSLSKEETLDHDHKASTESKGFLLDGTQYDIEERFNEEFHLNYEDYYDLVNEAVCVAGEAMDDPEVLAFFERELAVKGSIDYNKLAILVENDPRYFLLSPNNFKDESITVKQKIIPCPTKEEKISYILILLAKLRTLTRGTTPLQEMYELKADLLERRLKREGLLKDETPE